jgi:glutamyl-tRNA reductase
MPVTLVGVNHRTAPLALRERMAAADLLAGPELLAATSAVPDATGRSPGVLGEVIVLSTCNRLEVYGVAEHPPSGVAAIRQFLAQLGRIEPERLAPHLHEAEGRAAVEHLMRVAAGLESMMLGETQILGQVAAAAQRAKPVAGPILPRLFQRAVHAGKRARSETGISRHSTSVGQAAVLLAEEQTGGLAGARTVVVGAGRMAQAVARRLAHHAVGSITVISRTPPHSQALAATVRGRALDWSALPEALAHGDVVFSATSAPRHVIGVTAVQAALPARRGRPLLFVDIAVPTDVEEAVGGLPGVRRFDIDDLRWVIDSGLAERRAAIPAVEAIVAEETQAFLEWMSSHQVLPVIQGLHRRAQALADAEVQMALRRLGGLDQHGQRVVANLGHRIVKKLLHEPTTRLKSRAVAGTHSQALVELFALEVPVSGERSDQPSILARQGSGERSGDPVGLDQAAGGDGNA